MQDRSLHLNLTTGAASFSQQAGTLGPIGLAVSAEVDPGTTILGAGPLGDSAIPGGNRLILIGHSPLWRGLMISTMGSAGASLRALGVNTLLISGRAPRPGVLVVNASGAKMVPLDPGKAWANHPRGGTYRLLSHALGLATHEFPRVLATGPSAWTTPMGAIASAVRIEEGTPTLETWAGRGGLGSRLAQFHGVLAIVLDAPAAIGQQRSITVPQEIKDATRKYRYHPLLSTGGTLGSNLTTLREKLLAFNHRSMFWEPERRHALHERLVVGHYLAQYNRETHSGKRGRDCGETCPAVCKKVSGGKKKDYQPYAAFGPHIGVFDLPAAAGLADLTDDLGLDAVETGGLVGWAMECVAEGLVPAEDLGLDDTPDWDDQTFDPVGSSEHNARLATRLLGQITNPSSPLSSGIRRASKALGPAAAERALYVANANGGSMAPTHYWSPGTLAPVAIPGRYYTDYSIEFGEPEELGRRCADRMVRELALDNLGVCRFQREWAENSLGDLTSTVTGRSSDQIWGTHQQIALTLAARTRPVFWPTQRTVARVSSFMQEARRDRPDHEGIQRWAEAFRLDPASAGRSYWLGLQNGIAQGLHEFQAPQAARRLQISLSSP